MLSKQWLTCAVCQNIDNRRNRSLLCQIKDKMVRIPHIIATKWKALPILCWRHFLFQCLLAYTINQLLASPYGTSLISFLIDIFVDACECTAGGNYYRPVSADNCNSFIQDTSPGDNPGIATFHCPSGTVFDTSVCTCIITSACPSNCQAGAG